MRNATAVANNPLRLFATRSTGESMPKIAPYRSLSRSEQKALKSSGTAGARVRGAEDIVEITDHPFLDLMKQVNDWRDQYEHMQETVMFLQCTGNTYWYILTGSGIEAGIPKQILLLPSSDVRIVPGRDTPIEAYEYGRGAKRLRLRPDQVIHFREPSLRDVLYGMGRIEAAYDAVAGHEAIERYESGLARVPVPSLLLLAKGELTGRQRRELLMEWDRVLSEQGRDGRPLAGVSDSLLDVKPLSIPPRDIVAANGRRVRREEIVNAFDQTMGLFSESATRANADGAIYLWSRFGLDPLCTRLAQKMNSKLIPMYEGGERLFCAFDAMTKEDQEFLLRQDQTDSASSIRTRNEIRVARGLSPHDDPRADELFPPAPEPQVIVEPATASGRPAAPMKSVDGADIHPDLEGVDVWTE